MTILSEEALKLKIWPKFKNVDSSLTPFKFNIKVSYFSFVSFYSFFFSFHIFFLFFSFHFFFISFLFFFFFSCVFFFLSFFLVISFFLFLYYFPFFFSIISPSFSLLKSSLYYLHQTSKYLKTQLTLAFELCLTNYTFFWKFVLTFFCWVFLI